MRNLFYACTGAAVALLLPGCAPSYQVVLKPNATSTRWLAGTELLRTTADSLEADLGAVSTLNGWMEFDVIVRNRSQRPVLVAPEQFYVVATLPATRQTPESRVSVGAENPELRLQHLEQQAEYHQRQSTAVPLAEVLTTVASVVDDVSSSKRKETKQEFDARQAAYDAEMARYEQERTTNAVQVGNLREELRRYSESRLRKTTLEPGQTLQGRVRFPAWSPKATRLLVQLPIGGRMLSGEFFQTAYPLNSTTAPAVAPVAASVAPLK